MSSWRKDTSKSKLNELLPEETQGNVQPMRFRYASSLSSGARETATNDVSRAARWTTVRSKVSATSEQLLHPASHEGANMKW